MRIRTIVSALALAVVAGGCQSARAAQAGPDHRPGFDQRREMMARGGDRGPMMRGPGEAPVLSRLLRQSLRSLAEREGQDAARARIEALRESRREAIDGIQRGDRSAMIAAMQTTSLEMAETIIDIEGTEVVEQLLERGDARVERARERVAEARERGRDADRADAMLTRMEAAQVEARQQLAAGNAAEALITAARVAEAGPRNGPMRDRRRDDRGRGDRRR